MTITASGPGITAITPGAYILAGDGTLTGTGTASVTAAALGTLTVSGVGTAIEFSGITAVGVGINLTVTGGATATIDGLTGITALSNFNIGPSSTLVLAPNLGVSALTDVTFQDNTGTLELQSNNGVGLAVGDAILNYNSGDVIQLDGNDFTGGSYDPVAGVLTLTTAAGTQTSLAIANNNGNLTGEYFHLSFNGTNTTLTLNTNSTNGIPACYCRGTRIQTMRGERAIEELGIGDWVLTLNGTARTIRWVGTRSYSRRFMAKDPALLPVRFAAGSLGGGLPRRDLLVSPEHSMLLDGKLVPARCLVNGTTIIRERGLETVDYFHIELDEHDVIFAEGAPSESYIDDDSRGAFHNAAEYEALYGADGGPKTFYAPRVEQGPELEAIRARLAQPAVRRVAA
jgi:O-antigen biosynthesis protein